MFPVGAQRRKTEGEAVSPARGRSVLKRPLPDNGAEKRRKKVKNLDRNENCFIFMNYFV